jgi:hypothetical protein
MKSLIIALFLACSFYSNAQDTLKTIDQQEIVAWIVKETPFRFHLNTNNASKESNFKINKSEVYSVSYANGYKVIVNNNDIRFAKPFGVSIGATQYYSSYDGAASFNADYFLSSWLNLGITSSGHSSQIVANFYLNKANKNVKTFPFIGMGFGRDYDEINIEYLVMPIGLSKIFDNGLQITLKQETIFYMGVYPSDETSEFNLMLGLNIGYRF